MAESSPQNCIRSSEQYWLTHPSELVSSMTFFPSESMSLGSKLNAILRLTIIIFIILIFIGFPYALLFLIIGIGSNIGFYYMNKKHNE